MPLAKPRVALSASSPRSFLAPGFPLQSLTRDESDTLAIVASLDSTRINSSVPVATTTITPEQIAALVRMPDGDPMSYFDMLEAEVEVADTKARIRWHRIGHDLTTRQPDIQKLIDKLIRLLVDFACTRKERDDAVENLTRTGSSERFAALHEKARRLFTKSETTGEPGELLLYLLSEQVLKYPQVLCKFPHKTSPEMHAHGADGIHASVNPSNGHLRLHWGEAKLYKSLSDAVNDCMESLNELLLPQEGATKSKQRDIELLRDFMDLNDDALEKALAAYLDPDQPLSRKVEFCGIAVVGFDLKDYDKLSDELSKSAATEIAKRTASWSTTLGNAVKKHKLTDIVIDVFCIPFTSVQDFRDAFVSRLGA